jgi:hypothetical protein
LWGGLLFDYAGPAGPYVTTAAVMAVATAVALSLSRRIRAAMSTTPADLAGAPEPPVV